MADYWIKVRTCDGDGLPTDIVADLAIAVRRAADHRPWKVAIAESPAALRALEDDLAELDDDDDGPEPEPPPHHP